ncbi:MAG TPA: hypothetical protein DCY48_04765 [Candidatus Magasanikbacteria bacterium]|nr:MAG: hypothetical protein A3I74_03245 [Candidatus Magasanikbacteria bacterium RIFCSPLOWO2_02_FULL_47_16]OGH80226.1 MAG: hypothetical protein A3C10_03525 [Candidatus Magasanikbacteria bacterium RIFCSPHIGHO2_02_FULL_48_18]OGH82719.1 MAG: hypothetical protein A3G08_01540 [Candidatus Magasanikbacteria bacterium RIFCSPLOWO2_12_FULL_47_9b]HAZ29053.1 hypothetical protein [Candidatus Magasanikbacteria bacterium]
MIRTRQLLFLFVPAIVFAGFAVFIRYVEYHNAATPSAPAPSSEPLALVPIYPEDPIIGEKKAPLTVIGFEDFGCKGCQIQMAMLDELQQSFPEKIKIIWKGLPVMKFPYDSHLAHEYAFCMNQEGRFDAFKNFAFANGDNLSLAVLGQSIAAAGAEQTVFEACINSPEPKQYIETIELMAQSLNIQSVPTFFIDNKQIETPQTKEAWAALLGLSSL